ncbi:hypothetical protein HanIR_Chr04g0154361 [Helianthus annuus]|nr:hypothetical protein HanIR_Chr04g0154361 [Helianthus annuus]
MFNDLMCIVSLLFICQVWFMFVGALVSVLCLYFVMYKTMSFVCRVYVFCCICLSV